MFHRKSPDNSRTKALGGKMRFSRMDPAERLVLVGFRCWYAGYETGDLNCWEIAWNEYARELGAQKAKSVIGELSCWVRAVRGGACRNIGYFPFNCLGCSPDEACALSLIAACQHGDNRLAKVKAYDLVANGYLDTVVTAAEDYAGALSCAGLMLSPHSMTYDASSARV